MKLFFCFTETGCFEFLFTTDEQRAIQLFSIYVALAKDGLTKIRVKELTQDTVIPAHHKHLREALALDVEAFGSLDEEKGWVMHLVDDRFDQLSEVAAFVYMTKHAKDSATGRRLTSVASLAPGELIYLREGDEETPYRVLQSDPDHQPKLSSQLRRLLLRRKSRLL